MKKKILIIVFVIVIVIILILFYLFKNDNSKPLYRFTQNVTMVDNKIHDLDAVNGLKFTSGTISNSGGVYYISMTVSNNTADTIDMSNYRISLKNNNGEEIEYFQGTIIGEVLPKESLDFTVESYNDLSNLKTIYYEEFDLD